MSSRPPCRLALFIAAAIPLIGNGTGDAQTTSKPQFGKPPDLIESIAAMMRSQEPREQSWGAWYASRDHVHQLVPVLQELALQRQFPASLAERAARDIAIDALVQMNIVVPTDLLGDIYLRNPVEALILAARAERGAADEFALEVLRTSEGEPWYAAANLLLKSRPAELAGEVLRDLRIKAVLFVTDSAGISGGVGGGTSIGCGAAGAAPGLPPWPTYGLTTFAHPGATVLAIGPTSVYYTRTVSPAGAGPAVGRSTVHGPSADDRLRYLAALALISERELPLRGHESRAVVWTEAIDLESELRRFQLDVASRYERLLEMLINAQALTRETAAAHPPKIDVAVNDLRRPK